MNIPCPLIVNPAGTLGTLCVYAPCGCIKLCDLTACRFSRCGLLVKFASIGATTTDTVSIQGTMCGGTLPLVAESTGDLVTNSQLTAGTVYTVYPQRINGILRGVVAGL